MYNMEKARGKDPYEMFLSGNQPLITIKNPADTIIINNNCQDIMNGLRCITDNSCSDLKVCLEDFEFHNTMYPTINAIEDVFNELRK